MRAIFLLTLATILLAVVQARPAQRGDGNRDSLGARPNHPGKESFLERFVKKYPELLDVITEDCADVCPPAPRNTTAALECASCLLAETGSPAIAEFLSVISSVRNERGCDNRSSPGLSQMRQKDEPKEGESGDGDEMSVQSGDGEEESVEPEDSDEESIEPEDSDEESVESEDSDDEVSESSKGSEESASDDSASKRSASDSMSDESEGSEESVSEDSAAEESKSAKDEEEIIEEFDEQLRESFKALQLRRCSTQCSRLPLCTKPWLPCVCCLVKQSKSEGSEAAIELFKLMES